MPKRTDIQSILIVGAGPIVIGQACEFDYSGSQACRALKAEGYRIVLVNSNPATIMTDPDLADATYIEPLTPEVVAKVIEKERPDAILPTMGGQTALNTALSLRKMGVLEKYNCEMIGACAEAIDKAEDRDLFRSAMKKIGLETPKAAFVNVSTIKVEFAEAHEKEVKRIKDKLPEGEERQQALADFEREWTAKAAFRSEKLKLAAQAQALDAYEKIGLPAIIRPSFTLGGTGGGIAYSREELTEIVLTGVEASPTHEVLVEESVLGWKEFEMEVVRDKADNAIIICSIENIDPMGIHTGDSVTVAPALTLTDKEYQMMRNASLAVLREIGVETGGSNVQFAVNPEDGRLVVIEMNPRVSRSSALASKATGFPIAKVAAKLAVGFTLDEIKNEITGGATPASFEPSIDYVVTKMPRFTFEKFSGTEPLLTTAMKSVGEVMAIGSSFQESLQKAFRSLETGLSGLDEVEIPDLGEGDDLVALRAALSRPTPDRLLVVAEAYRRGAKEDLIFEATKIDPWFLRQVEALVKAEEVIATKGLPKSPKALRALKAAGFSDIRLAHLAGISEKAVRTKRRLMQVSPTYKRIDSCAAEFAAETAYMYSSYGETFSDELADEARISTRKKVMILGGGPNRIGQGIEFDYCCVHAAYALAEQGYETIMVNCNPETVSTDPETSDRLYFEPLTAEDVLEIVRREQEKGQLHGVIVQYGGQTPLKLAKALTEEGTPVLGTSVESLDRAEDRDRFKQLVETLGLKQPRNGIARSSSEAIAIAQRVGYPVVIRPSYVLGGRAMEIVHHQADLERYIRTAVAVSGSTPVLIDHYLQQAVEVDVDCLADGENAVIAGIMEHIEEAGIHSGDSACSLPPIGLSETIKVQLTEQTKALAEALDVRGLMNVQFAIKDDDLFLLEVNPRASRTIPFVAKVTGTPWAKLGARAMAGEKIADFYCPKRNLDYVAVKEAVFPFNRFPGVDVLLGPEMRSTGEVMGIDRGFAEAFAKSQLGAGQHLPKSGNVFISIRDTDKGEKIIQAARQMEKLGFSLLATGGTKAFFDEAGITSKRINKVLEGSPHIVDAIKSGEIAMIINTTDGAKSISDSLSLRQAAVAFKVPYFTTLAAAAALALALHSLATRPIEVRSLQDYLAD